MSAWLGLRLGLHLDNCFLVVLFFIPCYLYSVLQDPVSLYETQRKGRYSKMILVSLSLTILSDDWNEGLYRNGSFPGCLMPGQRKASGLWGKVVSPSKNLSDHLIRLKPGQCGSEMGRPHLDHACFDVHIPGPLLKKIKFILGPRRQT